MKEAFGKISPPSHWMKISSWPSDIGLLWQQLAPLFLGFFRIYKANRSIIHACWICWPLSPRSTHEFSPVKTTCLLGLFSYSFSRFLFKALNLGPSSELENTGRTMTALPRFANLYIILFDPGLCSEYYFCSASSVSRLLLIHRNRSLFVASLLRPSILLNQRTKVLISYAMVLQTFRVMNRRAYNRLNWAFKYMHHNTSNFTSSSNTKFKYAP